MTMAKNDELIAKLEAATGPDTDLDDEIAVAFGKKPKAWTCPTCGTSSFTIIQDYTRSIDSAMTILPKGAPLAILRDLAESGYANPAISICISALRSLL